MNNIKEVERILNSTKSDFATTIVNKTLGATRTLAQKTKDEKALQRMINAANDLARVSLDIPDIHITGSGTGPIAEPSVKITYPNMMNRVFYQGAPIQLIFETKNVHTPYSCYIFANSGGNKIDLFVGQNIRFDKHTIPNILVNKVNKELPPGRYDIFVVLYDNNAGQRKQLKDSQGKPVVDSTQRIMGIEIRPIAKGAFTPGTPEAKAEEAKGPKGLLGPHIAPGKTNPEIKITNKGDFGKVFAGTDQVPLIFEVKNIQNYTVGIFLQKDANNVINLGSRKSNKPMVKLSLPIRDLARKGLTKIGDPSLNLTDYKALVVILRDEHGNQLSGGKLMDSVDISIAPLAVSQRSENSASSNLRLLRPASGDSIPSSGPIDLEFETTLPTPFSYIVNIPRAGGLIHEAQSDYKYANTQFNPKAKYVDFVKDIKLKKGKFKFELHIYYPANSNTVVATKTIDVNIV